MYQADTTIQWTNKIISIIFTSKFLSENRKNVQMLTVQKDLDATPQGIVKSNTNSEYKIHIHKCYILDRKHRAPSTIHTIYFPIAHTSCLINVVLLWYHYRFWIHTISWTEIQFSSQNVGNCWLINISYIIPYTVQHS